MDIYGLSSRWKIWLLLGGMIIIGASLWYMHRLADKMEEQEHQRMSMMAELIKIQVSDLSASPGFDFTNISKLIEENTSIPMLLVDPFDNVMVMRNYPGKDLQKDTTFFRKELNWLKANSQPIAIDDPYVGKQFIYYRHSKLLQQLSIFPYVQITLIMILIAMGYAAFSYARRSEQNMVWVGMAKETAHQIGTPLTSLTGWAEAMRDPDIKNEEVRSIAAEIDHDIEHLNLVSERFSKIGSTPHLKPADVVEAIIGNIDYAQVRASRKVQFERPHNTEPIMANVNVLLFNWVIENLLKNALDAMGPEGTIKAEVQKVGKEIFIDISDTGKGIPRNRFTKIFRPGFTTKQRGWGLGLSLTKRIITQYHKGKIFVKDSVIGKGTTFRIVLKAIETKS